MLPTLRPQLRRARRYLIDVRRLSARWESRILTVDERVQDGHGTVGDTSVGVDLLEDCR